MPSRLLAALGFVRRPRVSVLFVCMGNICRSPMAEAVLRGKLERAGLADAVLVDSAGTYGGHAGEPADARAIAHAGRRGWDVSAHRARAVVADDFERFDMILAMDRRNLKDLVEDCPPARHPRLGLLGALRPGAGAGDDDEVVDPYYGAPAAFDDALDRIEPACDVLVARLRQRLREASGG